MEGSVLSGRSPRVVVYGLDAASPAGQRLRETLARENVALVEVGPECLGEQVGALAGLPGFARSGRLYVGPVPAEPFMLLCNLSDERLWQLVRALRAADATIALKCALTPTNRTWTLARLIDEVSQEHAAIQAQRAAAASRRPTE